MIDIKSLDPYESRLSVLKVHNRVFSAAELQFTHNRVISAAVQQSTYADGLSLDNYAVRYYMFLSTHVLYECWKSYNTEHGAQM